MKPESRVWRAVAVGAVLALVGLTVGFGHNGRLASDFWEHAAVVHALMQHPLHPSHPLFDLDTPHAFFSPYSLFWAVIGDVVGLDAERILVVASGVNVALLFTALVVFLRRASAFPWATAAIAIPSWLNVWGLRPWMWSGFFHFDALLDTGAYPSTFAAGLVFFALALTWDLRESSASAARVRLAAIFALTALCWSVHPMTAVIESASVFALFAARMPGPVRSAVIDLAVVAAALVAGFALANQWPYFSLFDLVTSPANHEFDAASHVLYTHLLSRLWPVLGIALTFFVRLRASRRDPLVALVLSALALYLLGAVAREGLGRALSWIGLYTQLAFAETLASLACQAPLDRQNVYAGITGLVTALFALVGHSGTVLGALPLGYPIDNGRAVLEGALHDDVVMADFTTGAPVPSLGGKVVGWRHPVYWVPDADDRRRAVGAFLIDTTSRVERIAILRRYHARYILLDKQMQATIRFTDLGRVIREDERYALLRVNAEIVP